MPTGDIRSSDVLTSLQWKALADNIRHGECTPFLGAGASAPTIPTSIELARDLATAFEYPLSDRDDLSRVVQFLALSSSDVNFPKREILKRIRACGSPEFAGDEPHYALASLSLPVYLTTNYDDFMVQALAAQNRKFRRDFCRWKPALAEHPSIWQRETDYRPSSEIPIVYHLHGCDLLAESLVATEDDYLEFIYNIAKSGSMTKTVKRSWEILPPPVMKAISTNCLLFLGYRLGDWNFRVIFRWLVLSLRKTQTRLKVAVQLSPAHDPQLAEQAQIYLTKYFHDMFDVVVFWGTANQFVSELRRHL
jgi:hypothetical protein